MTAAIVVATNGRRHWIAEPTSHGWRTLCRRTVTAISLLPENDPAGITCPACADRLAGAR